MSGTLAVAGNQLLNALLPADFRLIEPLLRPVHLPVRMPMELQGKPVRHVYFLDIGIASVVAHGIREIEVGLIGSEGMTGLSVLLGRKLPVTYETYMQVGGRGRRLDAAELAKLLRLSSAMHFVMLGFVDRFMNQTAQTALSNGSGKLDQRLARWLLMTHDRWHDNELPLTHEFIGIMLGVRRPGVTVALQEFERQGLISQRRSFVRMIDRKSLEGIAGANYVRGT